LKRKNTFSSKLEVNYKIDNRKLIFDILFYVLQRIIKPLVIPISVSVILHEKSIKIILSFALKATE